VATATVRSSLTAALAAANRRAGGGGSRGGRDHANSHTSGASQGGYDARRKIEELRQKKSATASDNDGFPAFSPVTPDFTRKTECISYVRQDHLHTHMIDKTRVIPLL
jgi:hypothetical protein